MTPVPAAAVPLTVLVVTRNEELNIERCLSSVRELADQVFVVDSESAELINGAILDYRDGLQGAGFHITNPNATKTCGCGSSFS